MTNLVEKYMLFELVEKIHRMRKYLASLDMQGSTSAADTTVSLFHSALNQIVEILELPATVIGQEPVDEYTRLSIHRKLSSCYHSLYKLHSKLEFIQADWVRPETYTFARQVLQHLAPSRSHQPLKIVLINSYTFRESNLFDKFSDVFSSSRLPHLSELETISNEHPTLFLPKLDFSNPLNWAILAHEIGHIDNPYSAELKASGEIEKLGFSSALNKTLYRWADEIFCDIFASRVLGAAYFSSFVSFALVTSSGGNGRASFSHPSNLERIRFLYEYISKTSNLLSLPSLHEDQPKFVPFYFELLEQTDAIDHRPMTDDEIIEFGFSNQLTSFLDCLRDIIARKEDAGQVREQDIRVLEKLQARLVRGIPIGSIGADVNNMGLISEQITGQDFDQLKIELSERPCSIDEILSAGWMYKLGHLFPAAIEHIMTSDSNNGGIKKSIAVIGEWLDELDDRLLKSIEASELLKLLEQE